jgi:hypothetical protein
MKVNRVPKVHPAVQEFKDHREYKALWEKEVVRAKLESPVIQAHKDRLVQQAHKARNRSQKYRITHICIVSS